MAQNGNKTIYVSSLLIYSQDDTLYSIKKCFCKKNRVTNKILQLKIVSYILNHTNVIAKRHLSWDIDYNKSNI